MNQEIDGIRRSAHETELLISAMKLDPVYGERAQIEAMRASIASLAHLIELLANCTSQLATAIDKMQENRKPFEGKR